MKTNKNYASNIRFKKTSQLKLYIKEGRTIHKRRLEDKFPFYERFVNDRESRFYCGGRRGVSMCEFITFGHQSPRAIKKRQQKTILSRIRRKFAIDIIPF